MQCRFILIKQCIFLISYVVCISQYKNSSGCDIRPAATYQADVQRSPHYSPHTYLHKSSQSVYRYMDVDVQAYINITVTVVWYNQL